MRFLEFFAGGGMARAGLGPAWRCAFANDFDSKKGEAYAANWGKSGLIIDDIRNIDPAELPESDLAWGSFPCQDLSLAGGGAGLRGDRSGTFWPFISLLRSLREQDRHPTVVAVENVVGTLTSHGGKDFTAIIEALIGLGYRPGAFVADAALFVPQSRPRLFVVAVRADRVATGAQSGPQAPWHTKALQRAFESLTANQKDKWVWWHMPAPLKREIRFADIIEDKPENVKWHTAQETRTLLSMMSEINLAKVQTAQAAGVRMVGTIYKRTRWAQGVKVQRAEIRFDDIAGCLRTPAGGSSRQSIMVVEGQRIRSRLISTRETARLMGLPDTYKLPERYNDAYHLTGDGVAVPVVRHIAKHIIEPLVCSNHTERAAQCLQSLATETLRSKP